MSEYSIEEMREDVSGMLDQASEDTLYGPFDYDDFHLVLPVMVDAGILLDEDTVDGGTAAYKIGTTSVCEITLVEAFKELTEQLQNASSAQVKRYATWISGCVNRSSGCESFEDDPTDG
jgi:hypothetical protein